MLVCDASLVVELCLDSIGAEFRAALGENDLVAPPLLWSEVPSVLHIGMARPIVTWCHVP